MERLVSLKVYPKGTSSGALVQINATKKLVVVGDGQGAPSSGSISSVAGPPLETTGLKPVPPETLRGNGQALSGSRSRSGWSVADSAGDKSLPNMPDTGKPSVSPEISQTDEHVLLDLPSTQENSDAKLFQEQEEDSHNGYVTSRKSKLRNDQ